MSEANKRRRTSPDTYVEVGDQENGTPVTPKRTSYQSPTKASLARSNPTALQMLDQAKQKRQSEPNRRESLRDAVLGNRNSQQAQRTPAQRAESGESDTGVSLHRADATTWIENSFRDIPPPDPAPLIPTPKRPYHPPIPSSAIIPRLVKNHTSASSERARRSASIELPPTPVQLGKESAPERPRGLLTSSPGGSGRRRVRVRNGSIQSSPLKPRELPPVHTEEDEALAEIASGIGEDVEDLPQNSGQTPEQDNNDNIFDDVEYDDDLPLGSYLELAEKDNDPKVQEKLEKLDMFQQQLRELKAQFSKLEEVSKRFDENDLNKEPIQRLQAVQLLLSSYEEPPESLVTRPENHDVFKQNAGKYLTAFAPHGLRMSYETWEQISKDNQKFVYQTTFVAPACWPQGTMLATFDIVVDLQSQKVESVKYMPDSSIARPLARWIAEKTDDSLTGKDVGSVSAGVAAYFQESIKRAKVFQHLENIRVAEDGSEIVLDLQSQVTTPAEASSLSQYLSESTFVYQIGEGQNTRTRRSLGSAKQIMLIYDISLDWIGNASAKIEITGSGFSNTILTNARRLFQEKLDVDGVVLAFNAVRSILGVDTDSVKNKATTAKAKGKQARRMTEAAFA